MRSVKYKTEIVVFLIMLCVLSGTIGTKRVNAAIREPVPKLSKNRLVMKNGTKQKLKIKNVQVGAKIYFRSDNGKVVRVTKRGKLIAKNPGRAIIKVTIQQAVTKTVLRCKVIVK